MKRSKVFLALLITSALSPSVGRASSVSKLYGAVSGGGGKGLVCQTGSAPQKVELLDLWEARTLFNEPPQVSPSPLEDRVDQLLVGLRDSYPFSGGGEIDDSGTIYQGRDFVLALLRQEANRFLKPDKSVLRLRNVTLELTDDSFEAARPAGCEIKQIVNYQPNGRVLINQDFYEQLDLTNQAALIAHEAFYSFLRAFDEERTSIRTRRAIGYVVSGKLFLSTVGTFPAASITCDSAELPYSRNSLILYPAAIQPSDHGLLNVIVQKNEGAQLVGLEKNTLEFPTAHPVLSLDEILSGQCQQGDSDSEMGFLLSGPVEFDRTIMLFWRCEHQTFSLYQQTTSADGNTPWVKLQCK